MPKIGDPIWIYDENRRVYNRDENGKCIGPPTFRGHMVKRTVTGETRNSWIVDKHYKIKKKLEPFQRICFSEEEVDRMAYVYENAHKVGMKVQSCRDYFKLREIEKILEGDPK